MRILHLSLSLAYLTVALARPLIPKTINHLSEADRQKALQYQILKDTKGNPAAYEWIWFCGMVLDGVTLASSDKSGLEHYNDLLDACRQRLVKYQQENPGSTTPSWAKQDIIRAAEQETQQSNTDQLSVDGDLATTELADRRPSISLPSTAEPLGQAVVDAGGVGMLWNMLKPVQQVSPAN